MWVKTQILIHQCALLHLRINAKKEKDNKYIWLVWESRFWTNVWGCLTCIAPAVSLHANDKARSDVRRSWRPNVLSRFTNLAFLLSTGPTCNDFRPFRCRNGNCIRRRQVSLARFTAAQGNRRPWYRPFKTYCNIIFLYWFNAQHKIQIIHDCLFSWHKHESSVIPSLR